MSNTFTYAVIFVVLGVFATIQVAIERLGLVGGEEVTMLGVTLGAWEAYVFGAAIIVVLSFVKAVFVAGWYQHLIEEPRSVTWLYLTGLAAAVALTVAAAYSIT